MNFEQADYKFYINMLSKNKSRFIVSLQKKKVREEEGLFVIEGDKIVKEFLAAGVLLKTLLAKKEFISGLTSSSRQYISEIEDITYEELKHISTLKTPHNALAVVEIPEKEMNAPELLNQLCVALDCIQDPGNLGTIIRASAWFGIKNIVCSPDCVDAFNPKVVQSTMGAILHVNVFYSELKYFLETALDNKIAVYGTVLDGEPLYSHKLTGNGVILLGNESRGISDDLIPLVTDKIMIPGAGRGIPGIESLNVSMAASIIFSEFQRQTGYSGNY
jgi:RNA methyltransferase, TrmH family